MILTNAKEVASILKNLIEIKETSKILNDFIVNFEKKSVKDKHNTNWLQGSFNLGGTISGRLSSSDPNLQNLPSTGTQYAKLVKGCIKPPKGWLFGGADFDALEDKISALTTRDPNKMKVYTEGFDGHSLRAYYYFPDKFPIIEETPESINKIKKDYPDLRQLEKAPYFALTYHGTWHAVQRTTGLSEEQSKQIERNHHKLYAKADEWVADRLKEASEKGYVKGAFGLKLRTPLITQTVYGSAKMPREAKKECKTAGNMLGQSYCLLNSRASNELQERLFESKFVYDIKPVAHIHDAQYFLFRDKPEVVHWLNTNLIECMQWQNLPEIKHEKVKLGGTLEIYYPSWKGKKTINNKGDIEYKPTKIPNNASLDQIKEILKSLTAAPQL